MALKHSVVKITLAAMFIAWAVSGLAAPIESGWNQVGLVEVMRRDAEQASAVSYGHPMPIIAAVTSIDDVPTKRHRPNLLVVEAVEEAVYDRPKIAAQTLPVARSTPQAIIDDLVPETFRSMLLATADRFGLDPRMVAAVIVVESEWTTKAQGKHNDLGLMQIIPDTARWIAKSLGMVDYDLFDAQTNLTMGTWYLKILFKEYGDWAQALAAYNGGPRAAQFGANHPYTQRVMRVYGER